MGAGGGKEGAARGKNEDEKQQRQQQQEGKMPHLLTLSSAPNGTKSYRRDEHASHTQFGPLKKEQIMLALFQLFMLSPFMKLMHG